MNKKETYVDTIIVLAVLHHIIKEWIMKPVYLGRGLCSLISHSNFLCFTEAMGSSVLIYWATDQYYEEEAFSDARLSSVLLPSSQRAFLL